LFGLKPESRTAATGSNAASKDRLKESQRTPLPRRTFHFHFRFHPAPHFPLALHFE